MIVIMISQFHIWEVSWSIRNNFYLLIIIKEWARANILMRRQADSRNPNSKLSPPITLKLSKRRGTEARTSCLRKPKHNSRFPRTSSKCPAGTSTTTKTIDRSHKSLRFRDLASLQWSGPRNRHPSFEPTMKHRIIWISRRRRKRKRRLITKSTSTPGKPVISLFEANITRKSWNWSRTTKTWRRSWSRKKWRSTTQKKTSTAWGRSSTIWKHREWSDSIKNYFTIINWVMDL